MSKSYLPQQYAELFETRLGQEIWIFLSEPDTILRMETATYLNRPAMEAVIPSFRLRFGSVAFDDQVKRMTGHMVRQVMEANGYELDRMGVRITAADKGFTTAARYKRANKRNDHAGRANVDDCTANQIPV
jgi:hypothetical protein